MKKHFEDLLAWCKSKGIKVTFVDSRRLHDYAGMNPDIAKVLGFKDIGKNEILLDREQDEDVQFHNLIHELVEKKQMDEGSPYWKSHCQALKAEKWPVRKAERFVLKKKTPPKSATIRVTRSK